jgi:hypothetical protein
MDIGKELRVIEVDEPKTEPIEIERVLVETPEPEFPTPKRV